MAVGRRHAAGSSRCGPSFFGLFTSGLASTASINSAGYGFRSACMASFRGVARRTTSRNRRARGSRASGRGTASPVRSQPW